MSLIFPYFGGEIRPFIPVTFEYKNKFVAITALVDSGSDVNMLLPVFADRLKIPYKRFTGSAKLIGGIGSGHKCVPWGLKCIIEGMNDEGKTEKCEIPMEVHIPIQKSSGFNLLGTQDFFEKFSVKIIHPQKTIILDKL